MLSPLDRAISTFDQMLKTFGGGRGQPARRPYPGANSGRFSPLNAADRLKASRLMRVNHAGEICAQALYFGQALTAQTAAEREALEAAAQEEGDHLVWCATRLRELEARPSRLDPVWFLGAFSLGALAGCAGTAASMGFLAETEHQVVAHLDTHLSMLPPEDVVSRQILIQMRQDEARHAASAQRHGARTLPITIRWLMRLQARVMTTIAARF